MSRSTRTFAAATLACAAAFAAPGVASAAFTSTVAGTTVTLTGDDTAETLVIGQAGGFLTHNQGAPFDNANDFDSATPGLQNVAAATANFVIGTAGGDDTLIFDRSDLTLGASTIDGGAGNDVLGGTEGADTINGGPGVDRLIGNQGGDTFNGEADDDTLVWNNGDGTDTMDGGTGQDGVEVNGALGAGDAFTLVAQGAGARFDRTNLVPFGLNITTAETVGVSGLGGDDTFGVGNGVPLGVRFDGGQGNDTFAGGDGDDAFFGGSGNDTGTGGPGRDLLDGQDDNDTLLARDAIGDLVRCGNGADSVQVDSSIVDVVTGCEIVDATAVPVIAPPPVRDTAAIAASVRSSTATLARNRRSFSLSLACPAAETSGCNVALAVTTSASVRIGSLRTRLLLGTASARLTPGQTRNVTVRVPAGVARLFRNRALGVRIAAVTTDGAGNVKEAAAKRVTLRLRRGR